MHKLKSCLSLLALINLSACATIVSGTQQSMFVDTPELEGASCKLTDSKSGTWILENTPGSVSVAKGNGPMNITCKKNGYKTATTSVEEEVAGATLGNVILGGGVGILVDAASGAAQKYPDKTVVWMQPVSWKSIEQRHTWEEKKKDYDLAQAKAEAEKQEAQNTPRKQH
jgi:hypothetical protein